VHAWIQKNRPELKARIILISGDTANSDTQAFLAKSGTPASRKPFRVQHLISVVEKTFGKTMSDETKTRYWWWMTSRAFAGCA